MGLTRLTEHERQNAPSLPGVGHVPPSGSLMLMSGRQPETAIRGVRDGDVLVWLGVVAAGMRQLKTRPFEQATIND